MSKKIPVALYDGSIELVENSPISCAVLNDENKTRVLSQTEMVKALGRSQGGSKRGEANLPRWISASNLNPYLSTVLKEAILNPIEYRTTNGSVAHGIDATLLSDILDVFLDAERDGKLHESQKDIAAKAYQLGKALKKTAIIALVDEATGFIKDKNRAKDELQKFLRQFMRDDAAVLVKRFEDSFFEMIYKMRGWTWDYTHKHPGVVGLWINDIVYERIAPLVLAELKVKNPITEKGGRAHKHHQFLTDEVGVPKLLNHLAAIEALGRASNYNWIKFMGMVDTAFPKQYQQLKLIFDDEEDNTKLPTSEFNKKLITALNYNPKEDKK